jgi:hypothetical protein
LAAYMRKESAKATPRRTGRTPEKPRTYPYPYAEES